MVNHDPLSIDIMARRKKGKNDLGEDLALCPECEGDRVYTSHVSLYYVNTGDHFCHSVKTYDNSSPAGCCDCDWKGVRSDLYPCDSAEVVSKTKAGVDFRQWTYSEGYPPDGDFRQWTYSEGYPPDGDYWCRADADDPDIWPLDVRDGAAYDHIGRRTIIYGFEWKLRRGPTGRGLNDDVP